MEIYVKPTWLPYYTSSSEVFYMATVAVTSCRVCCIALTSTHCAAIFSISAIDTNVPERLSKALDLPVANHDGQPAHLCRGCNKKFLAVESFRSLAKSSHDRHVGSLSSSRSPIASRIPVKRTKDTSGVGASPHTARYRPVAKRRTSGVPGRRLAYPIRDSCDVHCKINI